MAATIIKQHGGRIGVESSGISGEGSLFFIELKTVDPNKSLPTLTLQNMTPKPESEIKVEGQGQQFGIKKSLSSSNAIQVHPTQQYTEITTPPFHRALVVDDSHLIRKMLSKSLSSQFHFIDHVCVCT